MWWLWPKFQSIKLHKLFETNNHFIKPGETMKFDICMKYFCIVLFIEHNEDKLHEEDTFTRLLFCELKQTNSKMPFINKSRGTYHRQKPSSFFWNDGYVIYLLLSWSIVKYRPSWQSLLGPVLWVDISPNVQQIGIMYSELFRQPMSKLNKAFNFTKSKGDFDTV